MHKLLAEFIGTLFFCTVALLAGNPLAAAGVLAVLTYSLGYVSGGHFNPAVSLAVWLRGQLDRADFLRYCAAQAAGAIAAVLLHRIFIQDPGMIRPAEPGFVLSFSGETLFTFLAAFTFLHVRTARQQLGNQFYGLAAGLAWLAGNSAIARFSGGACNPALGLALAGAGLVPAWMIAVYVTAGIVAGAAASIVYRLMNPND